MQHELCPGWCIREHHEDDIKLDHYHQAEALTVPIEMSLHPVEARPKTFQYVDAAVRVARFTGTPAPFVFVEPVDVGTGQMALTFASAQRLAVVIQDTIEVARSAPGVRSW